MKFIGYVHEYDISSLPIDSKDNSNDLILNISGIDIHQSKLQNVLFYAPNVNSIRRIRRRRNGELHRRTPDGGYEIAISAPDVNLYLALSNMLASPVVEDKELTMPKNYQEALTLFDTYKDQINSEVFHYYKSMFEHELKEFDDTFSKQEVNRIY